MRYDPEFVKALEYGLPPYANYYLLLFRCAGLGIGIDRFVMILTDSERI